MSKQFCEYEFRPSATHRMNAGSADIISIAAFAFEKGYDIDKFIVGDAYLQPIGNVIEAKENSDALIGMIDHYGVEEAHAAMQDEYNNLYILGVKLSGDAKVEFHRNAVVRTTNQDVATDLLTEAVVQMPYLAVPVATATD